MNKTIIIGTRGSKLALWQANYVKVILEKLKLDSEIKIIRTKGDKIQNLSFEKVFFVIHNYNYKFMSIKF